MRQSACCAYILRVNAFPGRARSPCPPLLRTHQDEPNGRDVCDGSDHVASNNAYHCRHDGGLNHHSIGLAIEPIGELLDQLVIVLDMILAHRVIPSPSAPSRCGTLTRPHVKPDSLMV